MHEPVAAWSRLEGDNLGSAGVFQLRIHAESGLDLFAVVELPERKVGVKLEVSSEMVPTGGPLPSGGGFKIRAERAAAGRTRILILLERSEFREVFGEMCGDVVRWCLLAGKSEAKAVANLAERLFTWRDLFQGQGPLPLNEREQLGLHGELLFLESLLDRNVAPDRALSAWKGPLRDPHDFHLGSNHVEVKTTVSGKSAVVHIAGMRQLDPGTAENLFLWHYRMEGRDRTTGRTLAEQVQRLRARFGGAPMRALLDDRLLRSRYLDSHAAEHYDTFPFTLSREQCHSVDARFPTLTRGNVPQAVVEARYELDLDRVSAGHAILLQDAWTTVTESVAEAPTTTIVSVR
jgi:hypothetical protein